MVLDLYLGSVGVFVFRVPLGSTVKENKLDSLSYAL